MNGKHFSEKLGRNDPCPCGSGLRFQGVLPYLSEIRGNLSRRLLLGRRALQLAAARLAATLLPPNHKLQWARLPWATFGYAKPRPA